MDWLESILYGFVSGLAEILPISLTGHQTIMNHLFGVSQRQPLRDLLVHLAILGAIYLGWREELDLIRRERAVIARHTRGRRNLTGLRTVFDVRLIQTASLPLAILSFLWIATKQLEHSILFVVLFLILNGILLMIPEHLRQANK